MKKQINEFCYINDKKKSILMLNTHFYWPTIHNDSQKKKKKSKDIADTILWLDTVFNPGKSFLCPTNLFVCSSSVIKLPVREFKPPNTWGGAIDMWQQLTKITFF